MAHRTIACLKCKRIFIPWNKLQRFCSRKCYFPTLEERFWKHVKKTDDCWLWTGGQTHHGYGRVVHHPTRPQSRLAHRISWELHFGRIANPRQCVCHSCDNPLCVNPSHLFLGTRLDNAIDKVKKGRHPVGEQHKNAKLNESAIKEIRRLYVAGISQGKLAITYHVNRVTIRNIISRRAWAHVV